MSGRIIRGGEGRSGPLQPSRSGSTASFKVSLPKKDSGIPWMGIAMVAAIVGLAVLGTLAYYHVGLLAHIGDAGTQALSYGGWGGAGTLFLIKLGDYVLSSLRKKPHAQTTTEAIEKAGEERLLTKDKKQVALTSGKVHVEPFAATPQQATKKMSDYASKTADYGKTAPSSHALLEQLATQPALEGIKAEEDEKTFMSSGAATSGPALDRYEIFDLKYGAKPFELYVMTDPPKRDMSRFPTFISTYFAEHGKVDDKIIAEALTHAFVEIQNQELTFQRKPSGWSACCVLRMNGKIFVANVGNCRAVRYRKEMTTISLTEDSEARLGLANRDLSPENQLEAARPQISMVEENKKLNETLILATPSFWEDASVPDLHEALESFKDAPPKEIASRLVAASRKPTTVVAIQLK